MMIDTARELQALLTKVDPLEMDHTLDLEKTILASANAGAGKTSLLLKLKESAPVDNLFLQLTPEDSDPGFLLFRALRSFPAADGPFKRLQQEFPKITAGALLAMALDEVAPALTVLVDDFHLLEGTAGAELLLALFRHLPPGMRLVVTSQHQLPRLRGEPLLQLGPEWGEWKRQPVREIPSDFPANLKATLLALCQIQAITPTPDGRELVRRNIAFEAPGPSLRLHEEWRALGDRISTDSIPEATWALIEAETLLLFEQHFRTGRDAIVYDALMRIPEARRMRRPLLLTLEAELLYGQERYKEAISLLERCQRSHPDDRDLAFQLQEYQALQAYHTWRPEQILLDSEEVARLPKHAQGRYYFLLGLLEFENRDTAAAFASWQKGLAIEMGAGKLGASIRTKIIKAMFTKSNMLETFDDSMRYGALLASQIDRASLDKDRYDQYCLYLHVKAVQASSEEFLAYFFALPAATISLTNPAKLAKALLMFGFHLLNVAEYDLAYRLFSFLKKLSLSEEIREYASAAEYGVMLSLAHLGNLDRSMAIQAEFLRGDSGLMLSDVTIAEWAIILLQVGEFEAATNFIRENEHRIKSESNVKKLAFVADIIRYRQGDLEAQGNLRLRLQSPEFRSYWESDPRLLREADLMPRTPVFQLHAFGDLTLLADGVAVSKWPRRKTLTLLALLALNPQGMSVETLLDRLSPESEPPIPMYLFHAIATSLRRALDTIGAAHLIQSVGGIYRLKWDEIHFFDLKEFDLWYAKAQALEASNNSKAAGIYYGIALLYAQRDLFENLPQEFEAEKRQFQQKVDRARRFGSHPAL